MLVARGPYTNLRGRIVNFAGDYALVMLDGFSGPPVKVSVLDLDPVMFG